MRSDLAAEMSAYTAQAAVTASEQSAFDARLCEWKAAVTETCDTCKTCRGTPVPVFEVTVADVKPHEKSQGPLA